MFDFSLHGLTSFNCYDGKYNMKTELLNYSIHHENAMMLWCKKRKCNENRKEGSMCCIHRTKRINKYRKHPLFHSHANTITFRKKKEQLDFVECKYSIRLK